MKVERRIEIEKRIVKKLVETILTAGYAITINNGGDDDEIENSTDKTAILNEMFATDEERLYVMKDGQCYGGVHLVYGNDGYDVIANYHVKLDEELGLLEAANKLATELEEKYGG